MMNIVIMHNRWFYFSKTSSPICRVADPVVLDRPDPKSARFILVESKTGQIRVLLLFVSKTVLIQNRPDQKSARSDFFCSDQKRSLSKTGRIKNRPDPSIFVGSKHRQDSIILIWSENDRCRLSLVGSGFNQIYRIQIPFKIWRNRTYFYTIIIVSWNLGICKFIRLDPEPESRIRITPDPQLCLSAPGEITTLSPLKSMHKN